MEENRICMEVLMFGIQRNQSSGSCRRNEGLTTNHILFSTEWASQLCWWRRCVDGASPGRPFAHMCIHGSLKWPLLLQCCPRSSTPYSNQAGRIFPNCKWDYNTFFLWCLPTAFRVNLNSFIWLKNILCELAPAYLSSLISFFLLV